MQIGRQRRIGLWLKGFAIGSLLIAIDVISASRGFAQPSSTSSAQSGPQSGLVGSSINSDPGALPQMGVWIKPPYDTFVTASFPGIPDLVVDGRGSAFSPNGKHSPESKAPENYPEWIRRCFIFTNEGRTFLDKTSRRKTNEPWIRDDSPQHTQPFYWSQHYVGVWQDPLQPMFPANTSLTRYVVPIMGAVSRDDRHLIALAGDDTLYSAQAWNTCLHHVPKWTPTDVPLLQRHWRMKLYAMENDPDALLAHYHADFPGNPSAQQ